mmetsp:Transcript_26993/g.77446  ORF Transcript_26993/g.77446 Transcript_26993/m.77446 type:complete len:552 (+) Transcript_26993:165-1820(+)
MDRQKAPRANSSKKNLPAAFCSREVRVRSPLLPSGLPEGGSSATAAVPPRPRQRLSTGPRQRSPSCEPSRDGIRLDALVFLSSCPHKHGHLAMKKMLHPPTLELFCLLEIPGADHQRAPVRASLQDWLRRWCALQAKHPDLLVAVCEAFWDAPQGYPMGILCEYMPLGSLDELIKACGGLPEDALREVARTLLQALDALHSAQPPVVHGCVKPSQVLFTASGRPRLTLGLAQRLKLCQVWALPQSQGGGGAAASTYGGWDNEAGPAGAAVSGGPICPEQCPAVDIFDLGMLLLVSALGGQDILLDAIPFAREFGSRSARGPSAPLSAVFPDTCALLQHELRGAAGPGGEGAAGDMGYLPPASDLLFNRQYSGPFLAFVSTCLEAHNRCSPVSANDLLQHEFLHGQAPAGPCVSLREMQGLACLPNEAPGHDPAHFGGPLKSARSPVPGVAPSVAQSAQLYLLTIAQSIAPHCGGGIPGRVGGGNGAGGRARSLSDGEVLTGPRWRDQAWDTLLVDTARTLGLPRLVVRGALEAQLDRLSGPARERNLTDGG